MKGYAIIFARVIYAISWFYLAPAIPTLIEEMRIPISLAGFVPFSFFLGSGIMQLPSAYIASKIGARNSILLGLSIMSFSAFSVAFSENFYELLISYFIGGVGASLFFSTAAAILAILNEKEISKALGIYNAAFSLGGIIGLNWILLYQSIGFRYAVLLLSLITLLAAMLNINKPNYKPNWNFIGDRSVLYIGISTAGVWGIYYVIGELFPNFAKVYLHIQVLQGSEFTALLLVSSTIGGLLGFLGDRVDKIKLLVISSVLGVIPSLLLYTNLYLVGIILSGMFNELAISIAYALVSLKKGISSSISLAELNSINILLGSLLEPISSAIGKYVWLVDAVICLLPITLLSRVKQNI